MTLDGFLTVLALLAAIYAVLSPVQRLRLTLSWRAQILVAVPACLSILAFELFDFAPPGCPVSLGTVCRYVTLSDTDPGGARRFAFLIALAWLIAFVVIHRRSRPSPGSIPQFTRLANAQLEDEQYDDATRLIEPHLALLFSISRRRSTSQRLHDWLAGFGPVDRLSLAYFSRPPGPQPFHGRAWPEWAAKPVRALRIVVPAYVKQEQAAAELVQSLLNSQSLLDFIVRRRPYFGLALARQDVFGASDFFERYMCRLAANPGSALYQELSTNQYSEGMIGYGLPAGNRLLHYLFADVRNAERLSAWKPVGDYVERLLDGVERPDYRTRLNRDARWFDVERFSDPVFMAMFYFDIMVTSAARQGVVYDMCLYYLSHFADGLESVYDSSGDDVDREAEFPTCAAQLLYELMRFLTSWIGLYKRVSADSPLRRMPVRNDRAGGIPQSAALAAGHTLAMVLHSNRIDDGVVRTIHNVAMRALRGLPDDDGTGPMRQFLIESFLAAGHGTPPPGHLQRLSQRLGALDYFEQSELSDYRAAIHARMGLGDDAGGRRRPGRPME